MNKAKGPTRRRKNATRACEYCRTHHTRCIRTTDNESCVQCVERGVKCVYHVQKKRGPKPRLQASKQRKVRRTADAYAPRSLKPRQSVPKTIFAHNPSLPPGLYAHKPGQLPTNLNESYFRNYLNTFKAKILPFQQSVEQATFESLYSFTQTDCHSKPEFSLLALSVLARGALAEGHKQISKELCVRAKILVRGIDSQLAAIASARKRAAFDASAVAPEAARKIFYQAQGLLTLALHLFSEGNLRLALHYNRMAHELCVTANKEDTVINLLCLSNNTASLHVKDQLAALEQLKNRLLVPVQGCPAPSSSSSSEQTGTSPAHWESLYSRYGGESDESLMALLSLNVSIVVMQLDARIYLLRGGQAPKDQGDDDADVLLRCLSTLDEVDTFLRAKPDRVNFSRKLRGLPTEGDVADDNYCVSPIIATAYSAIVNALRAVIYCVLQPEGAIPLAEHALSFATPPYLESFPSLACVPFLLLLDIFTVTHSKTQKATVYLKARKVVKTLCERYPILRTRVQSNPHFVNPPPTAIAEPRAVVTKLLSVPKPEEVVSPSLQGNTSSDNLGDLIRSQFDGSKVEALFAAAAHERSFRNATSSPLSRPGGDSSDRISVGEDNKADSSLSALAIMGTAVEHRSATTKTWTEPAHTMSITSLLN